MQSLLSPTTVRYQIRAALCITTNLSADVPAVQEESDYQRSVRVRSCIRPHMMVSPSSADLGRLRSKAGLSSLQASLQTSHPAGVDANHCPAFGTGELQENGTTLCKRRRSAMPNNGDVPLDWRAAPRS